VHFDVNSLDRFPTDPGVYLMKNTLREVIYVGKAKQLKKRIKQYFVEGRDQRPMIPFLVAEIAEIETIVVFSEKEALLLENTLIKKHQPKYNAILKDDKTFISLMINHLHKWPMIKLVRYKGKPKEKGLYFGPYTSAFAARQTHELLMKLFPLRQCSDEELARRKRPCLLYGMKRCIAPCVNLCSHDQYMTFVEGAKAFLQGKDREIVSKLHREMEEASQALEFEKAAALHKTIKQIEHVTSASQVVAKASGKDADSFGIFRQADEVILMQLLIREGKLMGSEHYSFYNCLEEDEQLLSSFLLQYYRKIPTAPSEILVPIPLKDREVLEEILQEHHAKKIALLTPHRGDKKKLIALAEKNAAATFQMEKDAQEIRERMLLDLSETLKLTRYPRRIECFDTSNISGSDLVASMVVFTDGEKDKKRTRHYTIKGIHKGDDYAALHQVLSRRLIRAKEEDDLPDLIIVDGGKGQFQIAKEVFKELDIANVDLIALTKEEGRHDKGMSAERIFLLEQKEPILLPLRSPLLFLLQNIRDEAHRGALSFHRKRRQKRLLTSVLDEIPGIGPVKRKRLLAHFGSVEKTYAASDEELLAVPGIGPKDVKAIRQTSA
jgi:excinuclease ABC subunit C